LNLDKEKLILNEAVFSKAGGGQNGGPGVWPLVVEASFCLDFLVTFSSRKKQLGLRGYERYKILTYNSPISFDVIPAGRHSTKHTP
jgi:hypothetical protein